MKVPGSKFQVPSSKEAPSPKLELAAREAFGIWKLEFF
jgi:hypothetical protein